MEGLVITIRGLLILVAAFGIVLYSVRLLTDLWYTFTFLDHYNNGPHECMLQPAQRVVSYTEDAAPVAANVSSGVLLLRHGTKATVIHDPARDIDDAVESRQVTIRIEEGQFEGVEAHVKRKSLRIKDW
jgi:hypothetical protein